MLTVKKKYSNFSDELSTVEIKRIEDLVAVKTKELNDLQYQLNVFKAERMRVYQRNVIYMIEPFCQEAMNWLCALKSGTLNGEKIDRRKKYKEKGAYEFFESKIQEYLGHEVKLESISSYNFGQGYCVYFEYENMHWQLFIPVVNKIHQKNVDWCSNGRYAFALNISVQTSNSSWEVLDYTFEEEELKGIFEKGLAEYGKGN